MIDWKADHSDKFIGTTAAILSAIGAGVGAGASIYGANKQASGLDKSTAASLKYNEEALAYQKQQDAINRAQYLEERNRKYGIQNQLFNVPSAGPMTMRPQAVPINAPGPAGMSFRPPQPQ